MTDKALTPRTDEAVGHHFGDEIGGNNAAIRVTDLARSLESELATAQQKLDRFTRISELGESLGGELEEMETRIAAQQEVQRLKAEIDLYTAMQEQTPQYKIVCHSPNDRCLGCLHYHGKAAVCTYAATSESVEQEQPVAQLQERIAQLTAHRACGNQEQDTQNGKLAGYCVVCQIPWPCEIAKPLVAIPDARIIPEGSSVEQNTVTWVEKE